MDLNIVVLTGEICYVKDRYTSDNKKYVTFSIQQPYMEKRNGKYVVIGKNYFFCYYFNTHFEKKIKEGMKIAIQGRLKPYKTKDNVPGMTILVEKLNFLDEIDEKLNFMNEIDEKER